MWSFVVAMTASMAAHQAIAEQAKQTSRKPKDPRDMTTREFRQHLKDLADADHRRMREFHLQLRVKP